MKNQLTGHEFQFSYDDNGRRPQLSVHADQRYIVEQLLGALKADFICEDMFMNPQGKVTVVRFEFSDRYAEVLQRLLHELPDVRVPAPT